LDGLESIYPGAFDRIANVPVYNQRTQSYQKPNRFSRAGTADIIGCLNGRFIAIEVKTEKEYNWTWNFIQKRNGVGSVMPKNKKEDHAVDQINYLDSKRLHGGLCFFTYSLEHTLKTLKAEGL
jgi:penicillin-binding protein-related factor A (putative recombinase)